MSTSEAPFPQAQQWPVSDSNGDHLFTISWISRPSCIGTHSRKDCVGGEYVIKQYQEALQKHFRTLTGSEIGFDRWNCAHPLEVEVRNIRDYFRGRLWGQVIHSEEPGSTQPGLLVRLSNLNTDASPVIACQQRFATVLHELVHCFQFHSQFVSDWVSATIAQSRPRQVTTYRSAMRSLLDRFPLLIESTAYAIEAEYNGEIADWHKGLWNWACYPERALAADVSGVSASPFLQFLLRGLGGRFASELFRSPVGQLDGTPVTDLDAFAVLNLAIQRMPNASARSWTGLREAFRDFSLRSALDIAPDRLFDTRIFEAVGPRMRSGIYRLSQPVHVEISAGLKNAMSSRIFEFLLPAENAAARLLRLKPGCPAACTDAGVAQVAADGRTLQMSWLPATTPGFEDNIKLLPNCSRIILTTVNGRFGRGNAVNSTGAITVAAEIASV